MRVWPRLLHWQRAIQSGVVLQIRPFLDIQRQVNQHRAGAPRLRNAEGFAEDPGQLRWLFHLHTPLGDGAGNLRNFHSLERLPVQDKCRRLASDADDGDGVGQAGIESCNHIRPRRA